MADKSTAKTAAEESPPSSASNWFERMVRLSTRFERFAWDIGGVLCIALALMTLLAIWFPDSAGGLLVMWGEFLRKWMGWGAFWMAVWVFALAVWMFRHRIAPYASKSFFGRFIFLEIAAFSSLAFLSVINGISLERAEAGLDGGRIGWGLSELLQRLLSPLGLLTPLLLGALLFLIFLIGIIVSLSLYKPLLSWAKGYSTADEKGGMPVAGPGPIISEAPLDGAQSLVASSQKDKKKRTVIPAEFRKNFHLEPEDADQEGPAPPRDERLPGLDMLANERFHRPDERNINMTAGLIEKTLSEFGIPAHVVGFRVGPTVTQFAVEPGYKEKETNGDEEEAKRQKVRVSQISSLGRDLALALSAERLRIEAPVPGRPYVGIEVPNTRASIVRLRPILETETFYKSGSPLSLALGRDVSGHPVVTDLAAMPHMLIAGTTGSGKSVCIAALTTCLVMNNTPEDLRIVMIDPKMVELVRFNGLPHLYGKVETDLERILAVLRWVVAEMDRRYIVLESTRSRNIDTYNRKARRRKGMETLPRLVVMIDELADLMMSAPDQTEHNLVRLAQMARATGIHLVVATQRPSTDVVTGLIKANFPARISFAVASSVDSRVILDTAGAENLLGKGDMLYLPPEAAGPARLQGVMVNDQEVERVINFWQQSRPVEDDESQAPWDKMIEEEQILADRDNLVEKAIDLVRTTQRASASMLQRRLRIGYPRAARLIDELEEMGVIGPSVSGGRDREVLIEPEDDED